MSTAAVSRTGLIGVVLDYYERIDAGDVAGALGCFADHAVYYRPGYAELRGIEAITAYYREVRVIGSGRHTIHDAVSDGRIVAARGSFGGRSRTGDDLTVDFSDFWEFADGRVVERRTFFDAPAV